MGEQAKRAVEGRSAPEAAVEAEGKFVEVGGKVVREDCALVRSQKPPLQVTDDKVDHREIVARLLPLLGLQRPLMQVAELHQPVVGRPPVRGHP